MSLYLSEEAERYANRLARYAGLAVSVGANTVAQELLSEAKALTFEAPRRAAKAAAEWAQSQARAA